jgi:hypothetical protein
MKHKKKDVMVMFGGTNGVTPVNSTLVYDFATSSW